MWLMNGFSWRYFINRGSQCITHYMERAFPLLYYTEWWSSHWDISIIQMFKGNNRWHLYGPSVLKVSFPKVDLQNRSMTQEYSLSQMSFTRDFSPDFPRNIIFYSGHFIFMPCSAKSLECDHSCQYYIYKEGLNESNA